ATQQTPLFTHALPTDEKHRDKRFKFFRFFVSDAMNRQRGLYPLLPNTST
ncbi:unnamed protein product, partial [Acanthoscelides obtectus]